MKKILLAITSINWGQNGKNILLLAITSINWGQNEMKENTPRHHEYKLGPK
jgi:hypothetical protein